MERRSVPSILLRRVGADEYVVGIEKVIDNLNIYSQIRGGRLRSSSIVRKSRSRQLADADIHPSALSQSLRSSPLIRY
jgi:Ca2+-transporting ATPase